MSKPMTSAQFLEALAKSSDTQKEIIEQLTPFTTHDISGVPPEVIQEVIRILLDNLKSQHQMTIKMSLKFMDMSQKYRDLRKSQKS